MKKGFKFDFVFCEELSVALLAQGRTSEEIAKFFVDANKREDNLEYIVEETKSA